MGRAADDVELLLQPDDMVELMPRLAAIAARMDDHGVLVEAANNLGYFGPFETRLRRSHWKGCHAGRFMMGLEANGDVKGCPSLPSAPYVGGNVRDAPLAVLWAERGAIAFTRQRHKDEL